MRWDAWGGGGDNRRADGGGGGNRRAEGGGTTAERTGGGGTTAERGGDHLNIVRVALVSSTKPQAVTLWQ
jgi:hypothetical protein